MSDIVSALVEKMGADPIFCQIGIPDPKKVYKLPRIHFDVGIGDAIPDNLLPQRLSRDRTEQNPNPHVIARDRMRATGRSKIQILMSLERLPQI